MTFGELEGAKMVMIVDVPDNPDDISIIWGFVISRIRQIHVLFITSRALEAISNLEEIPISSVLETIRNRGLVPHVCSYSTEEKEGISRIFNWVNISFYGRNYSTFGMVSQIHL